MRGVLDWLAFQLWEDETVPHLLLALTLGIIIGMEREWRQRTAGLRTNALVALGAAGFVDLAGTIAQATTGVTQVVAYIVSGVGFLGAGAIMKEGANIRGLNTAATLWCSAAVGAASGAGAIQVAVAVAALVVFINTALGWLLRWLTPRPLPAEEGPAVVPYVIRITAATEAEAEIRAMLLRELEEADVTPLGLDREADSSLPGRLELTAEIDGAAAGATRALDRIADKLSREEGVMMIRWHRAAETTD